MCGTRMYRRAYPYSPNYHTLYRTVFVSINGLARTFTELLISQCTCYTLCNAISSHSGLSRACTQLPVSQQVNIVLNVHRNHNAY